MIDKRKLKLHLIVITLFFLVVSCNQGTGPNVNSAEELSGEDIVVKDSVLEAEIPLLTDADIDNAILEISNPENIIETVGIEDSLEVSLNSEEVDHSSSEELLPQVTAPGAKGFVCFIRFDPSVTGKWKLLRHNQQTDITQAIYGGTREIESVACSPDGNTLYFTLMGGSDTEVYRYIVGTSLTILTTDTIMQLDVSVSRDGNRVAWVDVAPSGRHIVRIRTYTSPSTFTDQYLSNIYSQKDASVTGDGNYVGFIRERPGLTNIAVVYNIVSNTYTNWHFSASDLGDISVADSAAKIAWKQQVGAGTTQRLYTKTSPGAVNVIKASSVNGIHHPHMAANGDYVTYGIKISGSWDVFYKKLSTNQTYVAHSSVAPVSFYAPYWQWQFSSTCIFGTGQFGTCTFGP